MDYRELGRTGWRVSTISFGAWAIGGTWGTVSDDDSMAAIRRALELGVNFFDTADVYGDGRSERLLAQLNRERNEPFYIATKAGRRLSCHGEEVDRGGTFSGLDFGIGLKAVEALRPLVPPGMTLAQMALRWILMFPEVTCAIPGQYGRHRWKRTWQRQAFPPFQRKR
jgi:aryl-alcohol dehydrogenase-like predicted oxidoreductase